MRKIFFITFSNLVLFLANMGRVQAQVAQELGIDELADAGVYLGTRSIQETIALVINIFLGFLGTLAVLLLLYGGFLWMTSRGAADKIQRAKMLIISAVIGLVIILASYGIARFVLSQLYDATVPGTPGTPGNGIPPPDGPGDCPAPADPTLPIICSINRSSGPAGTVIRIYGWNFDTNNNQSPDSDGRVEIGGVPAELVPCSETWRAREVRVIVPNLPLASHEIVLYNDLGFSSIENPHLQFNVTDAALGPNIYCLEPNSESVNDLPTAVDIKGVGFGSSIDSLSMRGWDEVNGVVVDLTNSDGLTIDDWQDELIRFTVPNNALTSQVIVGVGGQSDNELFTVSCQVNGDCLSDCCRSLSCLPASICAGSGTPGGPRIDYISPDNGNEGNLITIYGSGFGDWEGVVTFDAGAGATVNGVRPADINNQCSNTWTDNYIVIAVPGVAESGLLTITKDINEGGETSNGVQFTRNIIDRPGICHLDPQSGAFETSVTIHGLKFENNSEIHFGNFQSSVANYTNDFLYTTQVPNAEGNVGVIVESPIGEESNPYPFTALSQVSGLPIINSIGPTSGPIGQYITIMGANFGNTQGRVLFGSGVDERDGDFNFPAICGTNYWRNDRIIVKVPSGLPLGGQPIRVIRNSDLTESNSVNFDVIAGLPGPQICNVSPDNGPVGASVTFAGENFGTIMGSVVFHDGALATPSIWNNNQIISTVPNNAQTGLTIVRDNNNNESNPWPFNVGNCTSDQQCLDNGLGDICCPTSAGSSCMPGPSCDTVNFCEYIWNISSESGNLEVLNHSPDCDGACTTSELMVQFNREIDQATFNHTDPNDIRVLAGAMSVTPDGHTFSGNGRYLHVQLPTPLQSGVIYSIILGQDFEDIVGNSLVTPFEWDFTTGNTECVISDAQVTPLTYTSHLTNQIIDYRLNAINSSPQCGETIVYCDNCTYNWTLSNVLPNSSAAAIASGQNQQIVGVQNSLLVGQGSAEVLGTIFDGSTNFNSQGQLLMDITGSMSPPLAITNYWPNCDGMCSNADIGVRFNRAVLPSTVDISRIGIYQGGPSGTNIFNGTVDFSPNNTLMHLGYGGNLDIDTEYFVDLQDGFVSDANGQSTSRSWSFTTGDTECFANDVAVEPEEQLSTIPNSLSSFIAYPMSEVPGCLPQPFNCSNCSYSWYLSYEDPNGAALIEGQTDDQTFSLRNNLGAQEQGEVIAHVDLTQAGNTFYDYGTLNIDNSGTTVSYATPQVIYYHPQGPNVCTNVAPYLDFSELMNRESISQNIRLYHDNSGTLEELSGSFRFANMQLDGNSGLETRAIFNPASLLPTNSTFWMVIENPNTVFSQNGVSLDLAGSGLVASPNGELGWSFTTAGAVCRVHSASIEPHPDWFTCTGRNNCPADANLSLPGNQRSYEALVYSISGQSLNTSLLNFNWTLSNNLATLVNPASGLGVSSVLATSGLENGQLNIAANISSPEDGSAASTSGQINLFFCESPWPTLLSFPWNESRYNFSTFYCQYSGLPGSTSLPYLQYLPTPRDNFSADGLREYIFTINPSVTYSDVDNVRLGSLAFASDSVRQRKQAKENPFNRLLTFLGIEPVKGQQSIPLCVPNPPRNLQISGVTENSVSLSWLAPANPSGSQSSPQGYRVYRTIAGENNYTLLADLSLSTLTYTDTPVSAGQTYEYRVASYNMSCEGGDDTYSRSSPVVVTVGGGAQSGIDIIGLRIMRNDRHLSVQDWFLQHAPNPNVAGTLIEIDGYQALQVGNTIYIAATNIYPSNNNGLLYTNIYILAYNIGARPDTINIFNQLVENFKLNTNLTSNNNNVCESDNSISCSSDFDCDGRCLSQGLKLRRDTKRLGDLVSTFSRLQDYGNNHKACSGNSLISCSQDNDCPGIQTCVSYYPLLGSGTYVSGMSTSKWPSWLDTFSSALGGALSLDPINRFNGCPEGADPDTCWDQIVDPNQFICPQYSLVYLYNVLSSGQDYNLGANFEYDIFPAQYNANFVNRLRPTLSSLDINVNLGLDTYCNAQVINSPGGPASAYCGNGIVDGSEQCDGGFINACPSGVDWWNPQMVGCNPPGARDTNGALIECTWYEPDPPFSEAQCGGYCGDGTIQIYYEDCEGNNFSSNFNCSGNDTLICGDGCQAMCSNPGGNYPAAQCGDGIWSAGIEQCDSSANPSGLSNWGCTDGGIASCSSSSCQVTCSIGTPYEGYCGDGEVQLPYEQCDYASYVTPTPHGSGIVDVNGNIIGYGCNTLCQFTSQYCGDGTLQSQFSETCDYQMDYSTPSPPNSTPFNQYACRPHGVGYFTYNSVNYGACSPTYGGWCGDGIWDLGNDEFCDPGDPWRGIAQSPAPPSPDQSSLANQYSCRVDCLARTGGYCGDGIAQLAYGEICDGLHYPGRPSPAQSGPNNTYDCDMTSILRCQQSDPLGRYCGDGTLQQFFGESCDWGEGGNNPPSGSFPWPRGNDFSNFSSPNNQYECANCGLTGGWCGDGIVQQWEDCDAGFDPAEEIQKDVDMVYVFDMSGSMAADAGVLCGALNTVVNDLDNNYPQINYRITVYLMADGDGTSTTTPANTQDDFDNLFNDPTPANPQYSYWLNQAKSTFSALTTNCSLYNNPHNNPQAHPRVRYLSFYDNASNDISVNVDINGNTIYTDGQICDSNYDFAGRLENWGYAMERIISGYNWLPGYQRVIIPVSDQAASCGGNDFMYTNENYNASTVPDILVTTVNMANNSSVPIRISPVLRRGDNIRDIDDNSRNLFTVGQEISRDTGGIFTNEVDNWPSHIINTINSTFCDGRGDGFMDCTLP